MSLKKIKRKADKAEDKNNAMTLDEAKAYRAAKHVPQAKPKKVDRR